MGCLDTSWFLLNIVFTNQFMYQQVPSSGKHSSRYHAYSPMHNQHDSGTQRGCWRGTQNPPAMVAANENASCWQTAKQRRMFKPANGKRAGLRRMLMWHMEGCGQWEFVELANGGVGQGRCDSLTRFLGCIWLSLFPAMVQTSLRRASHSALAIQPWSNAAPRATLAHLSHALSHLPFASGFIAFGALWRLVEVEVLEWPRFMFRLGVAGIVESEGEL